MYYTLSLIQGLQNVLLGWLGDSDQSRILVNLIVISITILIYWITYVIIFRVFKRLSLRVVRDGSRVKPLLIQKQEILSAREMGVILNRTLTGISWILRLLVIFSFINTVLGLFSWTVELANAVAKFVRSVVSDTWRSLIDYLPDLLTILVVVGFAVMIIKLSKLVFEGMARQRIKIPGFYPEWSRTSFNLLRLLIIALTIVIIFPYLPGSGSPAFQGVSIFVGVLLSLGSTTAVANVVAGIVITFTRAFRTGDFVRISDIEGKVIDRTAFVTRIRTPKNVDVSLPNASVMADVVINYSSQGRRSGIRLFTSVTIGYDVPWPKVHELLLSAARNTEHVVEEPAPFVLQTSLDDNYVAYELNITTKRVSLRPQIYSALHGNILDAFHSAGVEITSPHYRAIRDGNEAAMAEVTSPV